MVNQSGSTPKKHVTTACKFCRRRKIKCDGEQPVCSNCRNNKRTCEYNCEADKRKISYKRSLNSLLSRVKLLERLLEENGIPVPPEDYDSNIVLSSTTTNLAAAQEEKSSPEQPLARVISSEHGLQNSSPPAATQKGTSDPLSTAQQATLPTPPFDDAESLHSRSASDADSITDELAAKVGSLKIAEDGQLRYYGPTSNLHIVHNGLFSLSRGTIRSVSEEGRTAMEKAGVGHQVDPEIELHLIKLYFAWEDPAIHVVDEDMFFTEKNKWSLGSTDTPFYSETLHNAICAVGASLNVEMNLGIPQPASEFFSARAKALLEIEMDSPSIATVQALVIMSATEAGYTRDARGWLYSGMAVRLSADLGLHLDVSEQVGRGLFTDRELEARRTTFWGVFIHESMWSLYLGRPEGISHQKITIGTPRTELDDQRKKQWVPYGNGSGRKPPDYPASLFDPIETYGDALVSLCDQMQQINRTLYSSQQADREDKMELLLFAREARDRLSSWHQSIPEDLEVDLQVDKPSDRRTYLPHVLQLHMQYYALCIFLDRPYFSRNLLRDPNVTSSAILGETRNARAHCTSSASAFVKVLKILREQHTLRQTNVQLVHLIFSASIIHAYNACLSPSRRPKVDGSYDALDDLQVCCQALREMGQSWQNATRALEVIICIKQAWQNKIASHHAPSVKRPSSTTVEDDASHPRNKQKTSGTMSFGPRDIMLPETAQTFSSKLRDLSNVGIGMPNPSSHTVGTEDISVDANSWQYLNFAEAGLTGLENIDQDASFQTAGGQDEMIYLMDNFDPLEDLLGLEMVDGIDFASH